MARRKRTRSWIDDVPPSDVEAERALLGSLILDPSLIPQAALLIQAIHFHADGHAKLYGCLLALVKDGVGVDAVTLRDRLKQAGDWDAVGGAGGLAEIMQSVPYSANWRHYLDIVLRCYARRSLFGSCVDLARDAHQDTRPLDDLCRHGQKLFSRMAKWLKDKGLLWF